MTTRYGDFRCKEVVNVTDGCRLGYVRDLELELPEGRITAIYVPGPCRFFGLFGHDGQYLIPWHCIQRFGRDIILVDIDRAACRVPKPKRLDFGGRFGPWAGRE